MKKKVLKGSLIAIVLLIATICGLFAYSEKISKIEVIENAKNSISKLVADATADGETSESGLIEVKDISKPQTIVEGSELVNAIDDIGRYQFNYTGCTVAYIENQSGTMSGFSHLPICAPYEKSYNSYESNSSGGYLDESYNKNGKIYKAFLSVEMTSYNNSSSKTILEAPITLLYGGKDGTSIVSGIKSTITEIYYSNFVNNDGVWASGFIDVTDFVKENGYGWYYGCNIPYYCTNSGIDSVSAWKLIVIEENTNVPIRKVSLQIGQQYMAKNSVELSVGNEDIPMKKNEDVTGQFLFSISGGDPHPTSSWYSILYQSGSNNVKKITTSNGLRTEQVPLCHVMSRNGIPIQNKGVWDNQYWYMGNAKYTTNNNNNNYFSVSGTDVELLDIDGTTDKHNIILDNNTTSTKLKANVGNAHVILHFLGVAADIDVPEYTSVQTAVGHDENYATVTGTVTNTSTSGNGMGMHDGTLIVKVDEGLKVISTNAYFTTASGERIDLTEDMYVIDEENNTITYTFGKDSNGKNLNGESLTYIIETECLQGDNVDGKKYTANNEVYANGKLINNNVETDHYMEKVVWDTSSVTIENPPFDGKTREANYTVEYYKDGEVANTETIAETIPELQTILTLDKTQINLENKYNGYKFEKVEIDGETVVELPNEIEEGKIIKVYYKLDELVLNTTVNLTAANGHGGVDLDWSTYDATNKIFKAYQRKDDEEGSEWESISTVDFYDTNLEPIKVLNVYPEKTQSNETMPTTTYTYADGTTKKLQKSAVLKVWIEGGKIGSETFENYAINPKTGKQLIEITQVSSTIFNNNPDIIWDYDVMMNGIWDGNGSPHLNSKALSTVEKYIKAGYGVLTGHDSIGYKHYTDGFNLIRKYFNIEVGAYWGVPNAVVDNTAMWHYASTTVEVNRNGLITNFPYELPVGTKLNIPLTHTTSNAAKGNVWMTLVDGTDNYGNGGSINDYYNNGGTGNPQYYLTTWNNTAMIQAGSTNESGASATSDERKVIANTLFYLKQITKSTSFTDNSSQDVKAPDKPIISVKGQDGNIVVNYKSEKDNGSTYSYYVESFDDQDLSIKLAKSNERTETVTTGIKGYYYVIDDQETNDFELTTDESGNVTTAYTEDISLTLDETNHGKYIHIKAVDAAGNTSEVAETKLQKLILNTKVNLDAANGHGGVDLDWSNNSTYDATGKVFKAYQKKEGSEEFETISTIDLYDENAEPVKVLNVYPESSSEVSIPTVTFRYLDGTSSNLPKSASLKVWMEGGTMTESGKVTTFEAYGKNPITGKQLLNITPVSSNDFNSNPEIIWNYDIVMFGTWDGNGSLSTQPNDIALIEIEKYIKAGKGVLTGHDSIGNNYYNRGLGKLRKYFNVEIGYYNGRPSDLSSIDYNTNWMYASNKVKVEKNGLLTNFPYELPLGAKLTVPLTHTCGNAALGYVWMSFIDGENRLGDINNYYNAGGTGSPVYYLTTWNNTAMIQTGHSNCQSTDDERKVLANTLFYLKQITKSTSFIDNSAQDLKAPNLPTAEFEGVKSTNDIKLSYNSEDNESTYSFYVQAFDQDDTTVAIDTSNTRTETVITGLKGYYYTIDENADNYDFDVTSANFTAESTVSGIDLSNNGQYVHVKAVDVAGNISEPTTVRIEVKSKVTVNLDGGKIGTDEGPIEKEGLAGEIEDIGLPEKEGYTFVGWETADGEITEGSEITYPIGEEEITAKWEVNNYKYKVNYYYDGVLNTEAIVEKEAPYMSSIEEYEAKMPEGYKFDKTENLPLTIGTIEENNIINVYYVADETKTKELTYTVEYYKNDEIVENDTEIVTETVQLLQPSLLDIDRTKANTTDKYRGYKLDKIQIDDEVVTELPETIETGKTIKIYYVPEVEDLVLDTKVNLEAANGHGGVDLDWNTEEHPYDPTDRIFRAFQKKDDEEGAEWESISTMDLYDTNLEPIKVLNVYMGVNYYAKVPNATFTYTNGTSEVLPKSASLKVWMEGGTINGTPFEAYGKNPLTGKQLLNVTSMSAEMFNQTPEKIWDYDIVMLGTWDGNPQDYWIQNDNTLNTLEQYIKSGYGVLIGHDTIGQNQVNGMNRLRKYFNIDVGYWENGKNNIDYDAKWAYGSTKVSIEKRGLITNFPYDLPSEVYLNIPFTHVTSQAAKGNVWMSLVEGVYHWSNSHGSDSIYDIQNYYNMGGTGNPQFYLTTWNNTAMIQTGSSNCETTSDERKVLANTLFYLKQRTNATSFTDNSSQDEKAPDKPIINVKGQDGNIVVNYKSEKDNGSTYSFRVEAYDDQRADILLAKSNERTETVTTGIKGYYYVIDDQETNDFELIRDEEGNVTNATYTEGLDGILELESSSNGKYIHVKAVDVAGNISEVAEAKLQKLVLDTEVNLGAANGHGGVDLDWSNNSTYDATGKVFKAFQRKDDEEGAEFETISTVDFYSTEIEPVKVLNVYPNKGNNLKTWMDTYGVNPKTGKKLMEVTPVTGSQFDANPQMLWNYDVVMFGSYDSNGAYQPNDKAIEELEKYINAGYGVLTGHDTIPGNNKNPDTGFSKLRKYFNIEIGITGVKNVEYDFTWQYGSRYVKVEKQGLLTNFPWELPLGSKLTVPLTHTLSQSSCGITWMTLTDGTDNMDNHGSIDKYYAAGGTGNPQYYLTTYNNTAMIQTGHSNGQATEDEQKVLANTLFYLKQITKSTSFTDNSSQDVKAPNAPSINFEGIKATNDIKLTYNSEDNGSTYSFYVQALDENDTTNVIDTSNTRTETVTTGLDGYYYIIDENPENHDFDVTDSTYTTESTANVDLSNNGKYVHMKAVDIAGNISEPTTVQIMIKVKQPLYLDGGTLNGEEGPVEKEVMPGVPTDLGLPEKEGYTFTGWEDPEGPIEGTEYTYPLEEVPITATWKANEYDYTVRHFEKGTTTEIATAVTKKADFASEILATDEAIEIDGFAYDSADKEKLTITANPANNTIDIYYTRVNGLSYKVNYLEKDTNEVIYPAKEVGDQTFGKVINATDEVIEIEGYNYDSVDKESITITTGENVLNIYYTKRNDLIYTVKYLEKDEDEDNSNNKVLATEKVVNNQIFKSEVTETAIDIEGYNKVEPTSKTITIEVEGNEIVFFYTKKTDLSYTVKYLEKDTNKELATAKTVDNQVFESEVTEDAIDIVGYNKVDPTSQTINIGVNENVITFYYTKRNDLSYTVKYLEKDSNIELATAKVVNSQVFEAEVTENAIDIEGYNKVDPTTATITIGVNTNEITFYYTKKDDLSYTVKYLEQGSNKELADEKVIKNKTFQDVVTENAIDIEGYNKVDPTSQSITIGVNENIITFYYTKRTDLSYTVRYVEEKTNNELATPKVVGERTFEEEITEQAIDIVGYDKVDPTTQSITIGVSGNEITFYYTKRTDLSYTVRYLEKDIEKEVAKDKVVNDQTFGTTISEQAIDVRGYDKVSPTDATIVIGVDRNIITFYYTKRTDLKYTVQYLDEDTEEEIAPSKLVENQTYMARATESAIDIEGYNKVAPTEQTIAIDVEDNLIKFYYTKRSDLSYTVKYLEQDTEAELHAPKLVNGQIFKSTVTEQAIDIDGYNKVDPTEKSIEIAVSGNEIKFYYIKRNDLSYTVNYLEKGSNKVLSTAKVVNNQIFGTVINAKDEVIEIDGYNFDSADKEEITISTKENVINVYYTKVTGLSYKVNYLDKETNEVINPAKVQGDQVFENVIKASDEVIEIPGYNYNSSDKEEITITTGENVLNLYYTKRTDLSYTVKYLEKDSNIELATAKVVNSQVFEAEVTESAIDIEGYDKVAPTDVTITIGVSGNEITFYYTKRNDLSYTVKYLEQDTNIELAPAKTVGDQVFEAKVTEEAIDIEGYNKVDPISSTITIGVSGNEITFYYTKRTDLSYTVKYLEKGTDTELAPSKNVDNQVFKSEVTENAIDVEGYNKVDPTTQTIVIEVEGNEIIFYYTKQNDLSYTVKYLEKDTNAILANEKFVPGQVFESEVTEEAIDIAGYDKVDPISQSITIGVSGNEITFYYTKRTDLSYTVKYLEQDTNAEVADTKVITDQVFESTVTESAIDVEGYNKVDPTSQTITIGVSGNEIVFYYTKRADLSYIVKYLDEDTEEEIAQAKVVGNQVFKSEVTEEAIDIEGYNKVDPTSQTIVIAVEGNEIKFYYTKRTDLSYTVKYLEQDTNLEVAESKTIGNKTLKELVTEKAIDVNGYNKVDPTEKSIEIQVSGNEIIFYYTKKADLSYTVKYLEQDTNTELAPSKTVNSQIFGSTATEQAIAIDGYNAEDPTQKSIQIATSGNEIKFYYTKRNDLSYTVNYLEKDTNIVLKESKLVGNQTFGAVIDTIEEKVAISGYDFDSIDKNQLTITTNLETNVINIFYTKGKFNYTVEYYYDNEIDSSKTATIEATFQDVITEYEDKNIPGYKLVNVEGLPLTVTEFPVMNVIKVYYVKDIFEYSVNYYYDEVLAPEKTEVSEGVFGTTIDTYKDKVEYGYELDRVENLPLTISKDPAQNVINVYYTRKDAQVIVKYVDKATNKEIAEETTKTGKVFDNFDVAEDKKDIEGYTLIEVPNPTAGRYEEEPQERTFYYAKNTRVIVKYLEKDTDEVVYPEIIIEGYEGKDYTTVEQNVENYTCVDNSGELNGKMTRDEITVIYYYLQNTKVVVNHIDQISSDILATEEQAGLVGDEYTSSAKDFAGYVLVEKPENETVTMAKDVITINYYYKKVSAGVIEKHIDIKSGELLDSTLYEGNEGDSYKTEEKSFYGYDIVADQMPENAEGEMTVEVIEVRYYYIRKASVKVEYIDKATNKTINETYQLEERDSTEYIRGYEGDPYKTVEKQFTGYDIVPELYPTNAEGIMQVIRDKNGNIVVDDNGNAVTETVVRYYYAYKTEVKERHLDVKTGEVLQEVTYKGHEGEDYNTSSKEITGYDLVEEKLPTNAKGKMTVDTITVDYYYIKNMTVKVEYIDTITNKTLTEKVQVPGRPGIYTDKDSTEIIKGHEGDEYRTTEKTFENYTIVKDKYPLNWQGTMELVQNPDGTTSTELVVKYYYVHVSSGVVEKHIDAITGKEIESETRYKGNEGDPYKTSSKEFKGYDLVKTKLPENAEGKMTKEEIVVKYYYIRKANVTVQYLEENTNKKLEADKVIEGHESERYYTEKKNIAGYEFVRIVGEKDGVLGKEEIVVKYYYKKIQTQTPNNNTNTTTPNKPKEPIIPGKDLPETGDIVPFVAGGVILLVTMANAIISIVRKKRK